MSCHGRTGLCNAVFRQGKHAATVSARRLILFSLAAYFWPRWFAEAGDPFVASRAYLGLLITVTMFAIGCLLPRAEVRQVFEKWPTVFGGTAVQYTVMPLLAFGCGRLFQLDAATMIGVTLVGCVPGAMASNVLTLAGRGNVSYSVSLTTSATLLSPVFVPLALWATLGTARQIDPLPISRNLVLQVVIPVVAGHLLRHHWTRMRRWTETLGPPLANATIIWIIAVVVGLNREELGSTTLSLLAALAAINGLGYLAGYSAGAAFRLPEAMRRALTLEVGMQNAGLGTVLASQFFPETPAAMIPTAAYTFGCMLTGTVLGQIWALRESPAGEPVLNEGAPEEA